MKPVSVNQTNYIPPGVNTGQSPASNSGGVPVNDTVSFGKSEPGITRKIIEKTAGFVTGAIPAVLSGVSGAVSGGMAGLECRDKEVKEPGLGAYNFTTVVIMSAAGIAAGISLIGGILGVGAGFFVGNGLGVELYETGRFEETGKKIGLASARAVADNMPTENRIKDKFRDFTEGGIAGGIEGMKEGYKAWETVGEGLVSGLIEGIQGAFK